MKPQNLHFKSHYLIDTIAPGYARATHTRCMKSMHPTHIMLQACRMQQMTTKPKIDL